MIQEVKQLKVKRESLRVYEPPTNSVPMSEQRTTANNVQIKQRSILTFQMGIMFLSGVLVSYIIVAACYLLYTSPFKKRTLFHPFLPSDGTHYDYASNTHRFLEVEAKSESDVTAANSHITAQSQQKDHRNRSTHSDTAFTRNIDTSRTFKTTNKKNRKHTLSSEVRMPQIKKISTALL